ncbi:VF530 family DNA-binding protein [Thermodesulfobacteriota bacterium]
MTTPPKNNPLHGITLEMIVTQLVDHFGWKKLGEKIPINCFTKEPSINSSLKLLRRTPWARKKVETLYIRSLFAINKKKQGKATT